MPLVDPIELLKRPDKWYLGNAGMLIYAPPFPANLDVPGFWDECHFGDLELKRLLCVSLALESSGGLVELEPRLTSWVWYPDRIEARYALGVQTGLARSEDVGLTLDETRRVGPDGVLRCELILAAHRARPHVVHVVAWTARCAGKSSDEGIADKFTDLHHYGHSLTYRQAAPRRAHGRGRQARRLTVSIRGSRKPSSLEVVPAHGAALLPRLAFTPFWDSLKAGRLTGKVVGDNVLGCLVYAGLHWKLKLAPGNLKPLAVSVGVRDPQAGSRPVPGRQIRRQAPPEVSDPAKAWSEFLGLVPHFECSDAMLTRYYWYRWYGLRLNAVPVGGEYIAPAVTEGIGYFRGVITYSLMCHLHELKWLADPALAQGCLRNHLAHQTRAGHFPGHIYVSHVNMKGFYHTDVGRAVGQLLAHHPSTGFAREVYDPLKRLLSFYVRERDREGLGLYDLRDQYETGQELASRYFHADKRADLYGWVHKLKLKGVDVTTYVYHLVRLLAQLALELGRLQEVRSFTEQAERIKAAVQGVLWDAERSFFVDYAVREKRRSPYLAAVGFYPLLSDLASGEQALACGAHLADPREFASSWPTPTVPLDDEYFSADSRWRGERANCPWNGRVWPMVNSHITEVCARLAQLRPKEYRPALATYLRRFVELMHYELPGKQGGKDFSRPNCFEHYSPTDGTASEYRGIDDYMHSWVSDLILKYVAGVRLEGRRLTVDPFPFRLTQLLLRDCRLAGHRLDVCLNRDRAGRAAKGYRVYLDGKLEFRATRPGPWEVEL